MEAQPRQERQKQDWRNAEFEPAVLNGKEGAAKLLRELAVRDGAEQFVLLECPRTVPEMRYF